MYNQALLEKEINGIFRKSLRLLPPDPDTDLFSEGALDSLMFVELLAALEQTFSMEIPLEELELDDFRSVSSIARFIINHEENGNTGEVISIDAALSARCRESG